MSFSNLAADCAHRPDHLTRNRLRLAVNMGTTTTTIVIWTGHILTDNAHSGSNWLLHSVVMTPFNVTNPDNGYANESAQEVRTESVRTLLHELSHQLRAVDHYCYGRNGNDTCSNENCDICVNKTEVRDCVMGNMGIDGVEDDEIYCDDCQNTIREHIEGHH